MRTARQSGLRPLSGNVGQHNCGSRPSQHEPNADGLLLVTITMSCSHLMRSKTIFPGAWPVRLRSIADVRSSKPTTSEIVDRSEPSAIS
jgi:hypothetical protein